MASRDVSITLKANIAGFVAGMSAAGQSANQFSNSLNDGVKKGGAGFTALSTGALAVGAAAAAGLGLAVTKFAQFDQAMSQVEAATMASAETMGQLEAAALKAGAVTAFSATEAAQGMTALAKAGVSTSDILGGALTGALDLAAAGELDVGTAAEIAATAMTQFGLAGADVPHIADLLAAAAGKAQGEVTDMAAALNQSGLVAAQMGLSIEETTGTLAAFASAGLIGSDAGTSFKTMLLRLANPSQEAADLMKKLGISAYDAQGNFVGMESIAGQLRDKLGGLTQQQRDAAMATMFGSDAIRAANVLYNEGAGGIAKWTAKVNDGGFAAEQAAIKTDNLAGDLERLGGSIDTALIQSGSAANDTLRFLTQTVMGMVNLFGELPGPVQAVATGLVALTAAVGLAGGAYGLIAPKIALANAALIATGPAGAKASAALGLVAKSAGILTVAFLAFQGIDALMSQGLGTVIEDGDVASGVLMDIAESGKITGASLKALGAETSSFGEMMEQTFRRGAGDSIAAFIDQTDDAVDEATRFFASVDNGLSAMVAGGRGEEAATVFKVIATEAAKSGVTVGEIAAALPEYAAAIKESMTAANTALEEAVASGSAEELATAITAAQMAIELGGLSAEQAAAKFPMLSDAMAILALISPDLSNQMNGVTTSILDTGVAADGVNTRLDALKAAMDRLTGGTVSAQQAQGDFTQALAALGESLTANGASFDNNTLAGSNNYDSLVSGAAAATESALAQYRLAAANGDSAAGYAAFTGSLEASKAALVNTLINMGVAADEANRLADEVLGIPTVAYVDSLLNDGVTAPLDASAAPRTAPVTAAADTGAAESELDVVANPRVAGVFAEPDVAYANGVLTETARNRVSPVVADPDTAYANGVLDENARRRVSPVFADPDVAAANGVLENNARPRTSPLTADPQVAAANGVLENNARPRTSPVTAAPSTAEAEGALYNVARPRTAPVYGAAATGEAEGALNNTSRGRTAPITASASTGSAEGALNNAARPRTATIYTRTVVAAAEGGYFGGFGGGGAVQSFPRGGPVWGAGTATSDSINARLSTGEFVNDAKSTARNRGELEAGNRGAKLMVVPGYAGGSPVPARTGPGKGWAGIDYDRLAAAVARHPILMDGRVVTAVTNQVNRRNAVR